MLSDDDSYYVEDENLGSEPPAGWIPPEFREEIYEDMTEAEIAGVLHPTVGLAVCHAWRPLA